MLLRIFKEDAFSTLKVKIFSAKNIFYFVLDILSQTFEVISQANLSKTRREEHVEINKQFKIELEKIMANSSLEQEEICNKAITTLFQLFSTSDSITTMTVNILH